MTRNAKALGLALVAVFAMSAVLASAAQAALKVTTAESPAILTGSSIGNQVFTVNPNTAEAAKFECTGVSGHATVNSGATSVTVTNIAVSGCTATMGGTTLPAIVHMEGCDVNFHGGAASGSADHFTGSEIDLVCPVGVTGPVITSLNSSGVRICKYTVWNFTNKKEITHTNTTGATDDFDLKMINVGIEVTRSEGILCPKPDETSLYNGEVTATAFRDLGSNPLTEGPQIGTTMSS